MAIGIPRLAALVGIVFLAAVACGGGDDATPTPPPAATPTPTPAGPRVIDVINHDLAGSGDYFFEPKEFTFSVGETVTFNILAETEYHTFTSDDLGIDWDVQSGESGTFEYTFDRAGTFKLICLVHELNGMTGTITVQ